MDCNGNLRYIKLASKFLVVARGDDQTEDLVRSGSQHQEEVTFGTMGQRVEGRIASMADWLLDDDLYVKRFACCAVATMRELAERADASLVEVLEEA